MRRASGESSTRTQDAPVAHLWFTTGLRHHEADSGKVLSGETVMAARPFNDKGRSANGNRRCVWRQRQERQTRQGQERQRTRAKESTRVNTRAVPSLRATVVTVESGDTSKNTVDTRVTFAEVDEEESVEPPNSSASSSTKRVTTPPPGLSLAGTAQSTTGSISTLVEAHAQSGWLCELVVGSDDARVRECEFVELLMDTGAIEHVCGLHDFTHAALKNGPRPALKTATGELLQHYSTRTVDFQESRRRTSSGLHSCRCEATNSECRKVDGQRR